MDSPARQRVRVLLFERGQGWLRWGMEEREAFGGFYEPPEWYWVAPPARRLWCYVWQWFQCAWAMVVGVKWNGEDRYRYSWTEARPVWPSDLKDDDDG